MKSAPRDISLVERQIAIAIKNNQPKVLAKLQKELADMEANRAPKMVCIATKENEKHL